MIRIAASSIRTAAIATSSPARGAAIVQQQRQLSMTCAQSIHKLNNILEEYRALK